MLRTGAKVILALAALFASNVVRADSFTVVPAHNWLLGDWGGARTRLFQQGVDLQLAYVNEIAYNPVGGARPWVDYADQVQFGATLDLERLVGLSDAGFQITFTVRTGWNLVENAGLDSLQIVQEVWGRGQTARLTELWYNQRFFGGLIDWKIGRTSMGADFAAFSCEFQNLTFCGSSPGNIAGGYIYNWPISQWGTRFKVALQDFGYFKVGVYDQNEQYLGFKDSVLPVFFPGSTGVLLPVELAWLPTFGGGTLPGSYKIGGWLSTSTASDVVLDINGNLRALTGAPALQHRGLYGAYINFQQQLTRTSSDNPKGGLNVFLNAVVADGKTSVLDRQIAGGMIYTGPISWRPNDNVGFAVGTTHVNSRVGDVQALQNSLGLGPVAVQNSEYVFELFYTVVPTPGMYVRPNVQYLVSPGGNSANTNVVVLGLKTVLTF